MPIIPGCFDVIGTLAIWKDHKLWFRSPELSGIESYLSDPFYLKPDAPCSYLSSRSTFGNKSPERRDDSRAFGCLQSLSILADLLAQHATDLLNRQLHSIMSQIAPGELLLWR
jgi:hypothetical protein